MSFHVCQSLRRAAAIAGTATAIVDGDLRLSWAAFFQQVQAAASGLRASGVRPGDRVAIAVPSGFSYLTLYFAVPWVGAVLVPLNTRWTAHEIAQALDDCDPTLIIVSQEVEAAEHALAMANVPSRVVWLSEDGGLGALDRLNGREEFLAFCADGDDPAAIFYTGGTTGGLKGAVLSHNNLCINALNTLWYLGLDDTSVHLHCGPLFHLASGARVYTSTFAAARQVILPRFEPSAVLETVEREKVTSLVLVPTMVRMLLDEQARARRDLSSLRIVTYGAAPMPPALLRELMAALPDCGFANGYGMTELSPTATAFTPADHRRWPQKLGSVGRPVPGVEIEILDANGQHVRCGAPGEIAVRGPTVMLGYWKQPELSASALRGGRMNTGDVGFLDDDGYLYLVDRLKDMIISGGENVYSVEVEAALADHPDVSECAVIGLCDIVWGERVHAIVVPRSGTSPSESEIIRFLRSRLAAYKVPRTVELMPDGLPKTAQNKIDKRKLRDCACQDQLGE